MRRVCGWVAAIVAVFLLFRPQPAAAQRRVPAAQRATTAIADVSPEESDLLSYSQAVFKAGLNQDSLQLANLASLKDVLAVIISRDGHLQGDVCRQVAEYLIGTMEYLSRATRRYDSVLLSIIENLEILLYTDARDALAPFVPRLQAIAATYPPGGVTTAFNGLITDIVERELHGPRVTKPQPPSNMPGVPGVFNRDQALFVTAEDVAGTRARLQAQDPETMRRVEAQRFLAAAAPALNDIPATMKYEPNTSDRLFQQGIALATLWRLGGQDAGTVEFEKAKRILLSFIIGFRSTEPHLRLNGGLDLASSMPSATLLFELLSPGLTLEEGQRIANGFSFIAEQSSRLRYGSESNLDPIVKRARQKSNHRTWQEAAIVSAGLVSGRVDLVRVAAGSLDPAVEDGGLRYHWREAYGPSLLLLEGPFGYQAYDALAMLVPALGIANARLSDLDLASYLNSRLEMILEAILTHMRANYTTPAVADSGWIMPRQYAPIFSMARRLYPQNSAFAWISSQEQPIGFVSWLVVPIALQVWDAPGQGQPPLPAENVNDDVGLLQFRQNPDLLNPGSATTFLTPNHERATNYSSHLMANYLSIEAHYGEVTWNVGFNPGFSAHNDAGQDADYWRSRAHSILLLDEKPGLGELPFDENGAKSKRLASEEWRSPNGAVHFGKGTMQGGYVRGGSDVSMRSFIQVDGPDGTPGYRYIQSNLRADASDPGRTVASLFHPEGELEDTNLTLTDTPDEPASPTFRYVKALRRTANTVMTSWFMRWKKTVKGTLFRFQIDVLPSTRGTVVTLGTGLEGNGYLHMKDAVPPGEPVNYLSSIVMQDLDGPQKPAQVSPLRSSQEEASGAILQGEGFRDWVLLSATERHARFTNTADSGEAVVMQGWYGVVRERRDAIDIFGSVRHLRLRPSAPITVVRWNGTDLKPNQWRLTEEGYVIVTLPKPSAAPTQTPTHTPRTLSGSS